MDKGFSALNEFLIENPGQFFALISPQTEEEMTILQLKQLHKQFPFSFFLKKRKRSGKQITSRMKFWCGWGEHAKTLYTHRPLPKKPRMASHKNYSGPSPIY